MRMNRVCGFGGRPALIWALVAASVLALGPALAADRKPARSGFGVSSPQSSEDRPCGRRGCDDRGRRDGRGYGRQGREHNWGEDYNSRGHRRGQRNGPGGQGRGGQEDPDSAFGSGWDEIRRNEALIVPAPRGDKTQTRSSGSIGRH